MKTISIVTPCYNEEANIIATLDTIQQALRDSPLRWEALVIDDASRDRSVELVIDYIRRLGANAAPLYATSSFSLGHAHTTRTSWPRATSRVANW